MNPRLVVSFLSVSLAALACDKPGPEPDRGTADKAAVPEQPATTHDAPKTADDTPPTPEPITKIEMKFEPSLVATIPADTTASELEFSPVGHQVAYIAKVGDEESVAVGDVRGEAFDRITGLYWNSTGTHLAYSGEREGKTIIVVDGEASPAYTGTTMPQWSPDGTTLAYAAAGGLVVGGEKVVPVGPVWEHMWSPDNRLVYIANQSPHTKAVIIDGKPGESFEYMLTLVWSRDGRHLAYAASVDDGMHIVIDGVKSPRPGIIGDSLRWSPNGERLAYSYSTEDEDDNEVVTLMLGAEQLGPFEKVGEVAWSPDSSQVVYTVQQHGKFELRGSRSSAAFDKVSGPHWSPDSQQLAYVTSRADKQQVVIGDVAGEAFDRVFSKSLAWSPDSTKLAYIAMHDGRPFVVVGTQKGEALDWVDLLHWSPDSTKVAYGARIGAELRWLVVPAT